MSLSDVCLPSLDEFITSNPPPLVNLDVCLSGPEYWIDDGWYVGKLREVPGVFSQGETLEELEANVVDGYDLMIGGRGGV